MDEKKVSVERNNVFEQIDKVKENQPRRPLFRYLKNGLDDYLFSFGGKIVGSTTEHPKAWMSLRIS